MIAQSRPSDAAAYLQAIRSGVAAKRRITAGRVRRCRAEGRLAASIAGIVGRRMGSAR